MQYGVQTLRINHIFTECIDLSSILDDLKKGFFTTVLLQKISLKIQVPNLNKDLPAWRKL